MALPDARWHAGCIPAVTMKNTTLLLAVLVLGFSTSALAQGTGTGGFSVHPSRGTGTGTIGGTGTRSGTGTRGRAGEGIVLRPSPMPPKPAEKPGWLGQLAGRVANTWNGMSATEKSIAVGLVAGVAFGGVLAPVAAAAGLLIPALTSVPLMASVFGATGAGLGWLMAPPEPQVAQAGPSGGLLGVAYQR